MTSRLAAIERRRARQIAIQVLFQDLFHNEGAWDWRSFVAARLTHCELVEPFCHSLVLGVRENRAALDELLQAAIPNWNVARLANVDLTVLRLAAFELNWTETPPKAVINEAIELARFFGGKESPSFVNGVLDRLLRQRGPR